MHKDAAKVEIEKKLVQDESLVGFFLAQKLPPFWLAFIVGPLMWLGLKTYFVSVTNLGVHFHKLNMLGKFSQHDFFPFKDVKSLKVSNGHMQIPMLYTFANGTTLKIRAQKRGMDRVAKIDEATIAHLKKHIQATT